MGKIRSEDDYIFRNNRMITSSPDIALTELVANAWDAGALHVDITLPTDEERNLCIKDDGCGMSEQEFNERWMTYGHLVDTASVKLFGLRQTLGEHYKNLDDECLVDKALKEPAQIKMRLEN